MGSTDPTHAGAPASGLRAPGAETRYAQLYFVGPHGPQSVAREVADVAATPQRALDLLLKGPSRAERARGLNTDITTLPGRLVAKADNRGVELRLPVAVAQMSSGGGLGLSQIICTAANAQVPGGEPPPDVEVRVYERGYGKPWTVRCNAAGSVVPVSER